MILVENTNTKKNLILVSYHSRRKPKVVRIPYPKTDTLLSLLMRQTTIRAEDRSYFSGYQTLSADKNWKSYYRTKLEKSGRIRVNQG
jgi:hypothetical protein